ncbi:ATP-binding protein [Marivita sp. XM-24bin2]|uniref:AAA family ATPase n=1 Tax=unclassified Marivita TaxID=2632480 RepID=UPI000D79EA5C|nr:ATP-binding protein [Marivita sp. XM-24bin2]MCR9109344.1 ATP-binding protein [Paracoccaceae bacterium]PWL35480.1 MAG: cell division protein ZipA [Marivita sp. XM-24bin2]
MHASPHLHLLCGKIAAGKSTLAAKLSIQPETVMISEDAWLKSLFADEMTTGADYVRFSGRLKAAMEPHVLALLAKGISVVLDFPANTRSQRGWLKHLSDETGVPHVLHYLDASDELCLQRLRARNAKGGHAFAVTDAQFWQFTKYFDPPSPEEGFNVVRHEQRPDAAE